MAIERGALPYMLLVKWAEGARDGEVGGERGLSLRAKMGLIFKSPYLRNGKSEPIWY